MDMDDTDSMDPMDSVAMFLTISKEDYITFYSIDRNLYTILVQDLWRDPSESIQIMAFWIWLERAGFGNVVKRILSLPVFLINELADEAITCLSYIKNRRLLISADTIPLTHSLMEKEISLHYLRDNRNAAVRGMSLVSKTVCTKALSDIKKEARRRNAVHASFLHSIAQLGIGVDNERVQERTREIHPDDRTMFVTFSKGYPVSEWEVRHFFCRVFGDCIESFYMQEVQDEGQALFARIVFYMPDIIDLILNGAVKAKFTINGKHVWMRKFVPKRRRAAMLP